MADPARIILFGDSITQVSFGEGRWGARLAHQYQRRADVLNRGYSGYNTRWALSLVDGVRDIEGSKVKLVTVLFGSNDCSSPSTNPRPHVPLDEYTLNMKEIVTRIQKNCPHAHIIVMTPPPICETALGNGSRTNADAGRYAAASKSIAAETGVVCLDLWSKMQEVETWRDFLCDGLHLSAQGGDFVGDQLLATINTHFPDISIQCCPATGRPANSGTKSELPQDAPWQDKITDADSLELQLALTPGFYLPRTKKRKTDIPAAAE